MPPINNCHPEVAEPVLLINSYKPQITPSVPRISNKVHARLPINAIASITSVSTACTGNNTTLRINLKAVQIPYNNVIIGSPFPSPSVLYKQLIGAHILEPGYFPVPNPVRFYKEFQGILQTPSYSFQSGF